MRRASLRRRSRWQAVLGPVPDDMTLLRAAEPTSPPPRPPLPLVARPGPKPPYPRHGGDELLCGRARLDREHLRPPAAGTVCALDEVAGHQLLHEASDLPRVLAREFGELRRGERLPAVAAREDQREQADLLQTRRPGLAREDPVEDLLS
jgi:hypothetical protein